MYSIKVIKKKRSKEISMMVLAPYQIELEKGYIFTFYAWDKTISFSNVIQWRENYFLFNY